MASRIYRGGGSFRSHTNRTSFQDRWLSRRWLLPLVPMAATPVLYRLDLVMTRCAGAVAHCDAPGPDSASTLLMAMNAPLELPRLLVAWSLQCDFICGDSFVEHVAIHAAAAGLLWLWVAHNLQNLRKRHSVYVFRWKPLSLITDLVLVMAGALSGTRLLWTLHGMASPFASCYPHSFWLQWIPMRVATCFCAAWCLSLIALFARDIVLTFDPKQAAPVQFRNHIPNPLIGASSSAIL
jgi:hypothetical protein